MSFPFEISGPAFRERQVRAWVFQRFARSFMEMTDLPLGEREPLAQRYPEIRPRPVLVQQTDDGETRKALFPGEYETVAMRYPDRRTVCVSSQAGCGLGCTFCATGQMGFVRNLTAWEIVAQCLWAGWIFGERPTNVVFMGMGEPLANLDEVIVAIRSIHDDIGIGARRITVSTVGLVPQIDKLAAEPLPVTLALSLHAPDDETRSKLVPLNNRWSVRECLDAVIRFRASHGRRATVEYALIDGVNDRSWQARRLAELLKGTDIHVNLIPLNPTPGYLVKGSPHVEAFAKELRGNGVNVTIRDTRGREIAAACGQLAVEAAEGASKEAARKTKSRAKASEKRAPSRRAGAGRAR